VQRHSPARRRTLAEHGLGGVSRGSQGAVSPTADTSVKTPKHSIGCPTLLAYVTLLYIERQSHIRRGRLQEGRQEARERRNAPGKRQSHSLWSFFIVNESAMNERHSTSHRHLFDSCSPRLVITTSPSCSSVVAYRHMIYSGGRLSPWCRYRAGIAVITAQCPCDQNKREKRALRGFIHHSQGNLCSSGLQEHVAFPNRWERVYRNKCLG